MLSLIDYFSIIVYLSIWYCNIISIILCTDRVALPFYRYFREENGDHFYTTNTDEIGVTRRGETGNHNYTSEWFQCSLLKHQVRNSVPLYRYVSVICGDHFYTTNPYEINVNVALVGAIGNNSYKYEGVAGYCFPYSNGWFNSSLWRYRKQGGCDHFYTTNWTEIGTNIRGHRGAGDYISEGRACYVYVPN